MKLSESSLWLKLLMGIMTIFWLSSCTTTGHFTSNPKSKYAFAGTEFIVSKNDSFEIRSWTDNYNIYVDSLGNPIWKENKYRGRGIYKCKGDSMQLSFTNRDTYIFYVDYRKVDGFDELDIVVCSELDNVVQAGHTAYDASGAILHRTPISLQDSIHYRFADSLRFSKLRLAGDFHRIRDPFVEVKDLKIGKNIIYKKAYDGYYSQGDIITIWYKPTTTGLRYKLGDRKRWLAKKYRWNFLNRFHE